MVAAATLHESVQDPRRKLFARAEFLVVRFGAALQVRRADGSSRRLSQGARGQLAYYLATGGTARHNATTAADLGVSPRMVSYRHAELRRVMVGPDVVLFDNPIDTPIGTVPAWDPAGGKVDANLHGPRIALEELVRFLEHVRQRRKDARDRDALDALRRARGEQPTAPAPERFVARRRRHDVERPPAAAVDDQDVAALAEQWNWLGLKNKDGSPSIVVIRPEPEDGSARRPTPEENTIRARLRAGRTRAELEDAIRGAGGDPWLRRGAARVAFAWAMNEWKGALERYAAAGRKLAATGKASWTSMKETATIHDLVSGATAPFSPKPPLPAGEAPAARPASPERGAPAAPETHNGACGAGKSGPPATPARSRVDPAPLRPLPPNGTPPRGTTERAGREGEQATGQPRATFVVPSSRANAARSVAVLRMLAEGGDAIVLDDAGRVVRHGRQGSWEERMRRVCGGCGQRSIGDDGRCTLCGTRKGGSS